MINQVMRMFEQFIQISERNHLSFFAGWCVLTLVLAFTIVYVWNKIIELVEKKKHRNDISLGSTENNRPVLLLPSDQSEYADCTD
jgi:hypothetical protein